MDLCLQIGAVVFFVVVFILPIVHIAILDKEGKVRPFDFKDKK